jgi:hypothetical protein
MEFFVRENEVTFNAIFFSLVSVGWCLRDGFLREILLVAR